MYGSATPSLYLNNKRCVLEEIICRNIYKFIMVFEGGFKNVAQQPIVKLLRPLSQTHVTSFTLINFNNVILPLQRQAIIVGLQACANNFSLGICVLLLLLLFYMKRAVGYCKNTNTTHMPLQPIKNRIRRTMFYNLLLSNRLIIIGYNQDLIQ